MSTGAIIGGVAGAVIGFFIGGPMGAMWGAAIGMGVGMGIESMNADVPSPGEPELGELSVNMAKEGALIPEIVGSPKLNANILWSYGSRVSEVTEKQEGGKGGGGGSEVVTGYKYYLTWIVGICMGPVDTLYTIYSNDNVVWHGELNCQVSGGKETITLDGMGSADFYFGTNDHEANSYIGSRLDDPTLNVPYRNLCWMLLKDCYIGDYNRAPSLYFVVKKNPDITALSSEDRAIEVYDYNAAHGIYYCLNIMASLPTTWLHADSFNEAAAILKAEGRGLTIQFNRQATAQSYIETILQHIGGILRYSGDSKLHLNLWRDTELVSSLPTIDEDSLLEAPTIDRRSWIDTLNEVRVQHTNRFFRDLVCPSGCDGFEGDISEISAGEKRTYSIENSDWDELEGNCSDLSFLSDGLPGSKQGVFDNLQKISAGKWSFDYTAHATLCAGQDPYNPEYCPIICGVRLNCCECSSIVAVDWDWDESIDTLTAGNNGVIAVKDGIGPYIWEIDVGESGSGWSLGVGQTSGLQNTLSVAPSGACGSAYIKVTDGCGNITHGSVRCTDCVSSDWVLNQNDVCVLSGSGDCNYVAPNNICNLYLGRGRQIQYTANLGGGCCWGTEAEALSHCIDYGAHCDTHYNCHPTAAIACTNCIDGVYPIGYHPAGCYVYLDPVNGWRYSNWCVGINGYDFYLWECIS